jgi:hypothetical protein
MDGARLSTYVYPDISSLFLGFLVFFLIEQVAS